MSDALLPAEVGDDLIELRRAFKKCLWALDLSEEELTSFHGTGDLSSIDEHLILNFRDKAGAKAFEISEKIIENTQTSDEWLRLKSLVVLHYANPDGDMVDYSAIRLAKAIISRTAHLDDDDNVADLSEVRLAKLHVSTSDPSIRQ